MERMSAANCVTYRDPLGAECRLNNQRLLEPSNAWLQQMSLVELSQLANGVWPECPTCSRSMGSNQPRHVYYIKQGIVCCCNCQQQLLDLHAAHCILHLKWLAEQQRWKQAAKAQGQEQHAAMEVGAQQLEQPHKAGTAALTRRQQQQQEQQPSEPGLQQQQPQPGQVPPPPAEQQQQPPPVTVTLGPQSQSRQGVPAPAPPHPKVGSAQPRPEAIPPQPPAQPPTQPQQQHQQEHKQTAQHQQPLVHQGPELQHPKPGGAPLQHTVRVGDRSSGVHQYSGVYHSLDDLRQKSRQAEQWVQQELQRRMQQRAQAVWSGASSSASAAPGERRQLARFVFKAPGVKAKRRRAAKSAGGSRKPVFYMYRVVVSTPSAAPDNRQDIPAVGIPQEQPAATESASAPPKGQQSSRSASTAAAAGTAR